MFETRQTRSMCCSSDMDKRRTWLIEIYVSLANCLCDLSTLDEDSWTLLNQIFKTLQKHIDLNDGKVAPCVYKYNLLKKSYGRVWKYLLKQIEEKNASQQQEFDEKLLQVI